MKVKVKALLVLMKTLHKQCTSFHVQIYSDLYIRSVTLECVWIASLSMELTHFGKRSEITNTLAESLTRYYNIEDFPGKEYS